jgi:hypothetical protein
MSGIPSLDVVIGMVIVFLTVSLVCSSINELIAAAVELRASTLEGALQSLLGGDLAKQVLAQPVIPSATTGDNTKRTPSYIEPTLFASALLDCILPEPSTDATASQQLAEAHSAITQPQGSLNESPAQRSLAALLRGARGDYNTFQADVANWYDAYMDRISGAYKRRSQWIIAVIAVLVIGGLNVDSFKIFKQLTTQPAFATALAGKANAIVNAGGPMATPPPSFGAAVDAVNARIASLPVPIGWHRDDSPAITPWWQKVVGLFITALAASLGAPFWFDALSKLANVRSAGTRPNGS